MAKVEADTLFRDTLFERGVNMRARTITTGSDVETGFFKHIDASLALLEDADIAAPITVRLFSHGGSLDEGLAVIDRLRASPCRIDIDAFGSADSAGFLILACGATGKRRAGKHTKLMMHGLSYALPEATHESQLKDVKTIEKETAMLINMLAAQTRESAGYWRKIIRSGVDHVFTSTEALELGVIDEIL